MNYVSSDYVGVLLLRNENLIIILILGHKLLYVFLIEMHFRKLLTIFLL